MQIEDRGNHFDERDERAFRGRMRLAAQREGREERRQFGGFGEAGPFGLAAGDAAEEAGDASARSA